MAGQYVYIEKKPDSLWEITGEPEDYFQELWPDAPILCHSKAEALRQAHAMAETLSQATSWPDYSIVVDDSPHAAATTPPPTVYTLSMQDAAADAAYAALETHGQNLTQYDWYHGERPPAVTNEELYKTAVSILKQMDYTEKVIDGAAWLLWIRTFKPTVTEHVAKWYKRKK